MDCKGQTEKRTQKRMSWEMSPVFVSMGLAASKPGPNMNIHSFGFSFDPKGKLNPRFQHAFAVKGFGEGKNPAGIVQFTGGVRQLLHFFVGNIADQITDDRDG